MAKKLAFHHRDKKAADIIKAWYSRIGKLGGRRGGLVRSEAKRKATRLNLAKARKAKAEKRLKGNVNV